MKWLQDRWRTAENGGLTSARYSDGRAVFDGLPRGRRLPEMWINLVCSECASTSPRRLASRRYYFHTFGSLAKLTAIRRASSLVSILAAVRRPGSSSK